MKIIRLLFLCLFWSTSLLAQVEAISGKVVSSSGEGISNVSIQSNYGGTVTNARGDFQLDVPIGVERVVLVLSHVAYVRDSVVLKRSDWVENNVRITLFIGQNMIPEVNLSEKVDREIGNTISVDPKTVEVLPGPLSGVEGVIKTMPGVSSNNEFSSQYNVRGGNFDENLVYVNDIEVYRPFLVRSGQQEGLSFVNPDMVADIRFSSGGFGARYGDKLSSVLDIQYKSPTEFMAVFNASLLGTGITVGDRSKDKKFTYLGSFRYRTNQLLLGSLDTDADFRPQYTDVQTFLDYELADRWHINFLGSYSRNKFQIIPETRTTDFGTIQEQLRLTVFFEGQEVNSYETGFGALTLRHDLSDQTILKFIVSGFQTQEQEYFDVRGQYRLGELENNLGSDNFGEVKVERGVGEFINYARNRLFAQVVNVQHKGAFTSTDQKQKVYWGAKFQVEDINDRLKEWIYLDSVGYSIPQASGDLVEMDESIDATNQLISQRATAYGQYDGETDIWGGTLRYSGGARLTYWNVNDELLFSPRGALSFESDSLPNMSFRLSGGVYYQPPFYREFRDFTGQLNTDIRSQRSIHLVGGMDYTFDWKDRPFKFTGEVYYKWLDNIIPYQLENVRLRYYARNNAEGYATGIDMRLNGEFVKGIESWASLSVMTIREDITDDSFVDDNGNTVEPGFIPKPTDQRVNFSVFFQDYLPSDPSFRVNLTLFFGTGLPFGAPGSERYEQIRRLPPYRRVDIGFTKTLLAEGHNLSKDHFFSDFETIWIGLEVFNLLGIRNTINYLWVKEISGGSVAVPNYLTNRLINLKLVAKL